MIQTKLLWQFFQFITWQGSYKIQIRESCNGSWKGWICFVWINPSCFSLLQWKIPNWFKHYKSDTKSEHNLQTRSGNRNESLTQNQTRKLQNLLWPRVPKYRNQREQKIWFKYLRHIEKSDSLFKKSDSRSFFVQVSTRLLKKEMIFKFLKYAALTKSTQITLRAPIAS